MKQKNQTSRDYIAGQNLKRAIKESEWKTQAKFAEAFHVDKRTVERWCQRNDSVRCLEEIAEFLGIRLQELLSL